MTDRHITPLSAADVALADAALKEEYLQAISSRHSTNVARIASAITTIVDRPHLIESLIRGNTLGALGYPLVFIHGLVIAAHGEPWSVMDPASMRDAFLPENDPDSSFCHLLGIWHHLVLHPSVKPEITWLDDALRKMLRSHTDMLAGADHIFTQLLVALAARTTYTPSPATRSLIDSIATSLSRTSAKGRALKFPDLVSASILSSLGMLPGDVLAHMQKTTPSDRITHLPVLKKLLAPNTLVADRPYQYHDLDTSGATEVYTMDSVFAHFDFDDESYHTIFLLSPFGRLQWLSLADHIAHLAPIFFALPSYAPAQFAGLTPAHWSQLLRSSSPQGRSTMFDLFARVQRHTAATQDSLVHPDR